MTSNDHAKVKMGPKCPIVALKKYTANAQFPKSPFYLCNNIFIQENNHFFLVSISSFALLLSEGTLSVSLLTCAKILWWWFSALRSCDCPILWPASDHTNDLKNEKCVGCFMANFLPLKCFIVVKSVSL